MTLKQKILLLGAIPVLLMALVVNLSNYMISKSDLEAAKNLLIAADVNAVPPLGVELKLKNYAGQEMPHDGTTYGRLMIKGPTIARAYFKDEGGDILDHEGFFDTGDVSTIDEQGFMQITDRAKDVIKSGGEWISSVELENAACGRFIGVGLELGGKDPAYVRADANLEHAVENLVDGSFFNSGQSCCAIERIYVDKKLYPAFVERFVDLTGQYVLGNPLNEDTTLGPLVSAGAADAVRGQIAAALAQGATALIDARAFPADLPGSAYLAPQVLVDVSHRMAVMREESFGPVVGIMPVDDDEHALTLMNDSPFGLSASLWTRDLAAAERLGNEIATGTVFMNRCDYLDPALAWTGVKHSGRGITLSRLGYEHLTRAKSFHLRHEV